MKKFDARLANRTVAYGNFYTFSNGVDPMQPLRIIRENPLILLGVAVAAFAGWVVSDSMGQRGNAPRQTGAPLPISIEAPLPEAEQAKGPSVVTSDQVPHLKTGMTRSEVEAIIGLPPADMVSPVVEVDGRMTYKAAYLANLDPGPAPIRGPMPVGRRLPPPPNSVPKSIIALEFDATKPGHPLVNIHVQAPKF